MSQYTGAEFVCEDINGITIYCAKEQWQYLIKHGEIKGQQGVIKAVLKSPDFINQSASRKNRHTYYKLLVLPDAGNTYVRVVVEFRSKFLREKKGNIINAFSCDGEQQGEVRIWTKS